MALTIEFPEPPAVPRRLPLLAVTVPGWDMDAAARLARELGVEGEVTDRGSRLVVAGDRSTLEVFLASDSVRLMGPAIGGDDGDGAGVRVDEGRAVEVAEQFLDRLGRPDAEVRARTVGGEEVVRLTLGERQPVSTLVARQVNYRYALEGLPLVGPGAKVQVSVAGEGEVTGAYRFWRNVSAIDQIAPVKPSVAFRRFSAGPMFAGLTDATARVEMESVELALFCSPPSEPQAVLLPAYVFAGRVSTELLPDRRFVSYLPAASIDGPRLKALRIPHAQPSVFATR